MVTLTKSPRTTTKLTGTNVSCKDTDRTLYSPLGPSSTGDCVVCEIIQLLNTLNRQALMLYLELQYTKLDTLDLGPVV